MNATPFEPDDLNSAHRQSRDERKKEALLLPILEEHHKVEDRCARAHKYHHLREQLKRIIADLQEDNPEQGTTKSDQVVMHYLFALLLLSAYVISVLLLYQSAAYLVGLLVGNNSLLQGLGILALPLAIIGLQVYTGIDLYLSETKSGAALAAKKWGAKVIVLVSPLLIFGTFIGETWGGLPLPHQLLLLLARMALASITDVAIVYNGERGFQALSFLLFGLRHLYLKRRFEELTKLMEVAAFDAVQSHQTFQQKCADFKVKFPDAPLTVPAFSAIARWVLERWQGVDFKQDS